MKTQIVNVTPTKAKEWLERNIDNRPLRDSVVEGLAEAIRRGEWKLSHQGIAFSKAGKVLDGQHRLEAILRANLSVPMMVTHDVDDDVFQVLDIGCRRTLSDVLDVPSGLAAAARYLAIVEDTQRRAGITPQYLIPYVKAVQFPYVALVTFCPRVTKVWSSAAVRAAAILRVLDGEDADYVHLVYHALNHAEFDSMPPVAQALVRQHLQGKVRAGQSTDFFVRCLKVFDRKQRDLKTIQISAIETGLQYAREVIKRRVHGVTFEKKKPTAKGGPRLSKVIEKYSGIPA